MDKLEDKKIMDMQISRINLKSDEHIDPVDGITVIVGPNNAGKSLLLREIATHISDQPHTNRAPFLALKSLEVEFRQTADELIEVLKQKVEYLEYDKAATHGYAEPIFRYNNETIMQESVVRSLWKPSEQSPRLGQLAPFYLLHFVADNRTNMTGDTGMYDTLTQTPSSPLQHMYMNDEIEMRLNTIVERTFGKTISLNRSRGTSLSLHLGRAEAKPTLPPSREYLEEMAELPRVDSQGDGMRSFIGMMLTVLAGSQQLLLIDEPEAFLHPPQARMLGKVLAELHQPGMQIIVSTHSSNIIKGITSVQHSKTAVSINRLSRHEDLNHVAAIPEKAVQKLYKDPLLKYSSVLDGLFYHGVVLCEAEGDCTYYAAVNDESTKPNLDLHFTNCNGKDRLPQAAAALYAAKVPTVTVADIDILNDAKKFSELVESHGGDPADFTTHITVIHDYVTGQTEKTLRDEARAAIVDVLDGSQDKYLSSEEAKRIRAELKDATGWNKLKIAGKVMLKGAPFTAFNKLDEKARKLGIFIVPVGELERFHPDVEATQKAHWLQEVLLQQKFKEQGAHHQFVEDIREYIDGRQ